MVLDISQLIQNDGAYREISAGISLEDLLFNGQEISFKAPVKIEGDISNTDGVLCLRLSAHADYTTQCSRCLTDTDATLDFKIDEVFSKTELENENDDIIILNSNEIDLKEIVEQAFCCALPITCLCSEDCKGLCPVCGCNLNTDSCSCENENVDPRLAVLKDFLK